MNSFFVSRVFAHQYRNLNSFKMEAHPRLNILFGHNGQGKTNIIEAISLALSTKTLRSVKSVMDLISHGETDARVEVNCLGESNLDSAVTLASGGRKFELFGKAIRDFSALLERVAVVSFVPEELQIVSAASSHRRKAINQIAAGLFPNYIGLYRRYEKALLSRNQLLKEPFVDPGEMRSFNKIYASLAAEITQYRAEAISLWLPFFNASIKDIVGQRFVLDAQYASSLSSDPDQALAQLSSLERDERIRRATLCGPHLDDLVFMIDEAESRFLASRGQARAIVLALKLGQLNAIAHLRKTPTVLLLDDVAGELDPEKIGYLMDTISRLNIQTFLTTTHLDGLFDFTADCATFEIEKGRIKYPSNHSGVDAFF